MLMRTAFLFCLLIVLPTPPVAAQQADPLIPSVNYDPSVPTYRQVLGYDAGERITTPAGIVRYMEALARAVPARMRVFEYASSWEERPLIYAVIGSETNIGRLEEIRDGMARLADPRTTEEAAARELVGSLPASVWLAYGIHGNEVSSPEAALLTAYHLLAARGNETVDAILENALVFIDPLQNPDGRERFVHHFVQSVGLEPNANPDSLEHTEPWPGGRGNHYLFDMNRDWFALTQPETRGRVKIWLEWHPLVFTDLHEMGSDATYYFTPEAVPYNPHLTEDQRTSLEWFGRNNARWFDQFGFAYFNREVFDAFYPGYGAGWPAYHGAIAMTYEQGSTRGLVVERRRDGQLVWFRDAIRHHFVASVSTCETVAAHREELLRNFRDYRRTAIEEGAKEPVRSYILPRRGNTAAVDKLAELLAAQGIEVSRARRPFRASDRDVPAGSYVIDKAQPSKRLIRTLLDPEVDMEADFIKEQERRRGKNLESEIYDVVAWALPLNYNVEMITSDRQVTGDFERLSAGSAAFGEVHGGDAKLAYLVPWDSSAAARLLTGALRDGWKLWSADREFTLDGRQYPRGSLIARIHENTGDVHERIRILASGAGAEVYATDTGWVDEGISLGSNRMIPMSAPSVAIAWDRPAASYSAGQARFVLERQYGYPVTPVRAHLLAEQDTEIQRFDVIILPDTADATSYTDTLGAEGMKRLKEWVSNGGTLIGIAGAVADLANPDIDLLAISREDQPREDQEKESKAAGADEEKKREARVPGKTLETEAAYLAAIEPEEELPDSIPGVLLRARLDPDHWITAGLPQTVQAMVEGRSIYTPIRLDKGVNAALFLGPDELRAAGYLWEENRKLLAYKPLVVVQPSGRGMVIGFTADPNFRAFMDGMNQLFLNAVFRSQAPARSR